MAAGAVATTGEGYLSGAPVRMSSRNDTDGGRGSVVDGAIGGFDAV